MGGSVITTLQGDCRETLATLPAGSVQCVVTSPPYFGLRKYSDDPREIGQEATPALYVAALVEVFAQLWRVLRDDGTVWLNLGDSYAANGTPGASNLAELGKRYSGGGHKRDEVQKPKKSVPSGLKEKDLIGIPWRVAFALQDAGWYLRSDIIWAKPNCMPESVRDRPTRAHEYVFLLTKSARYFYDADAIREAHKPESIKRSQYALNIGQGGDAATLGKRSGNWKPEQINHSAGRNRRTVWSIATQPFSGTKVAADYVGADGKPYKASSSCPIHWHLAKKQNGQTPQYDEQPDQTLIRNADIQSNLAPELAAEHHANSLRATDDQADHSEDESQAYNSQPQTIESNHDHKTSDLHPLEDIAHAQTHDHTKNSCNQCVHQPDRTYCSCRASLAVASEHSTEVHKTGRAPESDQPCTPSDQMTDDTRHTPVLPDSVAPNQNTFSSKSAAGSAPDDLFSQMGIDIADSEKSPLFSPKVLRRNGSTKHYTCTCTECQTDHYATMPEALIEPCILAGSSAQACEHCGAAWVRQSEPTGHINKREPAHVPGNTATTVDSTGWAPTSRSTNTFAPACACENNTGSAASVVLDPFAGSGTVSRVAMRLQRNAIGCELNPDYISEHIEKRTDGVQVELFV